MTTYTAERVEAAGRGSRITVRRGADAYRSEVRRVEADGTVTCTLKPLMGYVRGNQDGWVASDDRATRFWRAKYLGGTRFKLSGAPVDRSAFGGEGVLRLWEYGVGDTARRRTSVSWRRREPGLFELAADTAVTLTVPARAARISTDGATWRALKAKTAGGRLTFAVPPVAQALVRLAK